MTHEVGQFVLVVPSGWTALENTAEHLHMWSVEGFRDLVERESWGEIDGLAESVGQLPAGMTVSAALFVDTINDGPDRYQVYLQFIPLN